MYVCLDERVHSLSQASDLALVVGYVEDFNLNPPEFFISSFFGKYTKIGCFHLPTHRRDPHRNFFDNPFVN